MFPKGADWTIANLHNRIRAFWKYEKENIQNEAMAEADALAEARYEADLEAQAEFEAEGLAAQAQAETEAYESMKDATESTDPNF